MNLSNYNKILTPTFGYCFLRAIPILGFILILLIGSYFIPDIFPGQNLVIIVLALVFSIMYIYSFFFTRSFKYIIDDEKIKFSRGILSRKIDFLELYRIKDFTVQQNLFFRFINSMNLTLNTSDKSHPEFTFLGIPYSDFSEELRLLVEHQRKIKRVYEID